MTSSESKVIDALDLGVQAMSNEGVTGGIFQDVSVLSHVDFFGTELGHDPNVTCFSGLLIMSWLQWTMALHIQCTSYQSLEDGFTCSLDLW